MKKKKEDLRVRRTKKLLSNSLFKLIKKKPFDKISVCNICEVAMVHRATFYSHFADKYELLSYSLDEHIPFNTADSSDITKDISSVANDIIVNVIENKDIYSSIIRRNNDFSIIKKFKTVLEDKICERIKNSIPDWGNLSITPEFYASYYTGACINVLEKWVNDEIELSANELSENLNTILSLSLKSII